MAKKKAEAEEIDNSLDPVVLKNIDFIEAYLVCMNGTQAWKEINPEADTNTAAVSASRLLRNIKIRAYLEKRFSQMSMGKNEVIKRLRDIANATLFPFVKVDVDGHVYFNFADPDAKRHMYLIRKLKSKKQESSNEKTGQYSEEKWIEVELHDAMKALELLGRYHVLFTDKTETTDRKIIKVTISKDA